MNGVAIAGIAVGVLAQVSGMLNNGSVSGGSTIFAAICVILAVALHVVARASLAGIEE